MQKYNFFYKTQKNGRYIALFIGFRYFLYIIIIKSAL